MRQLPARAFVAALIVFLPTWMVHASAALIVNPARPITHRVAVQIVQTSLNDGSSPATVFGSSTQRADIEAKIDSIWAQAGIDIDFLPNIRRYNNTFAYQGGGAERPTSDLNAILSSARGAGILHSDPSVINMFFVNITPGFAQLSEWTAAGLARIGNNGIAQFVGDNLLSLSGNRDVIAGVVAHEIGHNLGLKHTGTGQANIMSPSGASEQLSEAQIAAIFQTTRRNDSVAFIPTGGTGLPQLVEIDTLAGDYNADGTVNAADYTVWRDAHGSTSNLAADGNNNRIIDSGDYTTWKANFGQSRPVRFATSISVPEPATLLQAFAAVAIGIAGGAIRRPGSRAN